MKQRLYETPLGKFEEAQYPGGNYSGCHPLGDRVLVLYDKAPEKTAGGIYLTDMTKEDNSAASEAGIIIAIGDDAFTWNSDRSRRFNGRKPIAGERVYFERYAGSIVHGLDGRLYRLMDDRCIGGLLDSRAESDTGNVAAA